MKYLAFDLETARIVPEDEEWRVHRPLGISCYALAWRSVDGIKTVHGFGKDNTARDSADRDSADRESASQPQPQMSRAECRTLVDELTEYVRQGFTLLTWNGLGFDFDILAEEAGMHEECCALARAHVDMMFHFFCLQGYPLGLNAAAKGMGLAGKIEGMDGSQAPLLWQQGAYGKVLEYVTQDALMTLALGEEVAARRQIRWQTRKGKANRAAITQWLPVCDALALPLPKPTWLRVPMTREHFTAWMDRAK